MATCEVESLIHEVDIEPDVPGWIRMWQANQELIGTGVHGTDLYTALPVIILPNGICFRLKDEFEYQVVSAGIRDRPPKQFGDVSIFLLPFSFIREKYRGKNLANTNGVYSNFADSFLREGMPFVIQREKGDNELKAVHHHKGNILLVAPGNLMDYQPNEDDLDLKSCQRFSYPAWIRMRDYRNYYGRPRSRSGIMFQSVSDWMFGLNSEQKMIREYQYRMLGEWGENRKVEDVIYRYEPLK